MNTTLIKHDRLTHSDLLTGIRRGRLVNGSEVFALPTLTPGLMKIELIYHDTKVFAANPVLGEMTFQLLKSGTKRLETLAFVAAVEETGVMINSYATMDSGVVELVVLDEQLPVLLPLLFEMLDEPSFPEKEFERIRTTALQHYSISRQQTRAVARDHFMAGLFPQHPYGTLVTDQTISSITHSEMLAFHQKHILHAQPAIFIAAFDPDRVMTELNRFLSSAGSKEKYDENREILDSISSKPNTENSYPLHVPLNGGVQSSIRLGKVLFGRAHPDYHVAKVTMTLLGGYFSSRLMANLREDKGYTYGVGAGIYSMAEGGYMAVSADVGNEYLEKAISEIHREVDRLAMEKVDEEELQTVKLYLSGSYLRETDGVFNQLNLLSLLHKHRLGKEWVDDYQERLNIIGVDDIARFARKHLGYDDMILVTCGK